MYLCLGSVLMVPNSMRQFEDVHLLALLLWSIHPRSSDLQLWSPLLIATPDIGPPKRPAQTRERRSKKPNGADSGKLPATRLPSLRPGTGSRMTGIRLEWLWRESLYPATHTCAGRVCKIVIRRRRTVPNQCARWHVS